METITFFSKVIILSLFALVSCSHEIETEEVNTPTAINSIDITVEDFVFGDIQTRTILTPTQEGVEFTWAANDTIGIFPDQGAQAYFPMISGVGTNRASFTGGGWALKPSSIYAAYYPFIGSFYIDRKTIPISYEGMIQVGNDNATHLGAYDYLAAVANTPTDGNVNFNFKHFGAIARVDLTLEKETTYTQLKLKTGNSFVIKGTLNPFTQEITPTETSDTFVLNLENITTESNGILKLYLILAPTDLSTTTLTATVIDDNNYSVTKIIKGKDLEAGKAHGMPEVTNQNSNINIDIDPWTN